MFGLGKIQEAQKKMQEVKDRLETISVSGESENGLVKVETTVTKKIISVKLPEIDGNTNREELERNIVIAINRAFEQADAVSKSEMEAAARDLLPGMGGMLSGLFNK